MAIDPRRVLTDAIAAVPAVKYASGIAGIAAAIAIVGSFKLGLPVAALGTVVMLGLMTALLLFARAAGAGQPTEVQGPNILEGPAVLMVWVFTLLTCATGVMIFSVTFFGKPHTWHDIFPAVAHPGSIIGADTPRAGDTTRAVDTTQVSVPDIRPPILCATITTVFRRVQIESESKLSLSHPASSEIRRLRRTMNVG
jgi:hypothetical protein